MQTSSLSSRLLRSRCGCRVPAGSRGLPAPTVGTVLLALRHRRANHKHVTRAALRLLLEHAEAAQFVRTHRRMAVSIVEHAVGKATARGVVRSLRTGEET